MAGGKLLPDAFSDEADPILRAMIKAINLKSFAADGSIGWTQCRAALEAALAAAPSAQPEQAKPTAIALTDADIDVHLSAVLRASGSSLRNYSNALMLSNMRAAMIAAMSHLTAPHGDSDKTVGSV